MKRLIQSGLMVASVSLMLSVPAFANTTPVDRTGARINNTSTYHGTGTLNGTGTMNRTFNGTRTNGIDGLGTNRDFTNGVWDGGIPRGNATNGIIGNNGNNRYGTNNYTGYGTNNNGNYRVRATTNNNGNWGWLGLLGLIGLAGMRSRNPQGNR